MNIIQNFVPSRKYNIKCPYGMTPKYVVIHNTANDASARNEIQYMINNNNQISYHVAIDDREAVEAIPFNRNAWHAGDGGNGAGNRSGIGIEICYSRSGGPRFDQAEKNAASYVAGVLRQYGWGIDRVKKHQDFSGKYCPHRTLDRGWQRFLNMVQIELNSSIDEIAREVINGKWGNGQDRVNRLTSAGYDYNAVQARVNQLLR